MAPLIAAQLKEHPEFPNVIWDLKPTAKGKIAVAEGRGGPFDISYEIHGTGDICLVVRLTNQSHLHVLSSISTSIHIIRSACCSSRWSHSFIQYSFTFSSKSVSTRHVSPQRTPIRFSVSNSAP
jgi:hypothetical protein